MESTLNILAWNIQRGVATKLSDENFLSVIKPCDVCILTECWFPDQFDSTDYELDEFNMFTYRRNKCRGGGICILIKKSFEAKINVVKCSEDSLIWLRIDSSILTQNNDLYLCCAYIPPEGNAFYGHYNCDLYETLETDLMYYSDLGESGA